MNPKDFKTLAIMLTLSIVFGFGIIIYGTIGRQQPENVDVVWKKVDEVRAQIASDDLKIEEGESLDSTYFKYHVRLTRLKSEEKNVEKYILHLQSSYPYLHDAGWYPSSWEIGLVGYQSENHPKYVSVVVSKRLSE